MIARILALWTDRAPREKNLLLAAVVGLALVSIRYGVVGPYLTYLDGLHEEAELLRQRIERLTRVAVREPGAAEHRQALEQRMPELLPQFVPGDNSQLAAAALVERINTLARQEGLQVGTTRVAGEVSAGEFRRIVVQAELQGELTGVTRLVAALEFGPWRVSIPTLNIRRQAGFAQSNDTSVLVTLGVSGIVQGSVQKVG